MLVKDFIKKYPNDSFDMMTPGGFVFLTPGQAKDLLAGKSVAGHPGDPEDAMCIDAEELLTEPVCSVWTYVNTLDKKSGKTKPLFLIPHPPSAEGSCNQ